MRMPARTATTVPVAEAERDLRNVLRIVDRRGFVRLTRNGKVRYHIEKEEPEAKVLARLKASVREHREGKTRILRSLADL